MDFRCLWFIGRFHHVFESLDFRSKKMGSSVNWGFVVKVVFIRFGEETGLYCFE